MENTQRGGNREFIRIITGSHDDSFNRGDVRRAARSAWAVQRDATGQAYADEAGIMAGRQMVARSGKRQRTLLGNCASDQEADAAGNLRATVYVQSSDIESSVPVEGIRRGDTDYMSASVVWSGAGGIQKREEWLGALRWVLVIRAADPDARRCGLA